MRLNILIHFRPIYFAALFLANFSMAQSLQVEQVIDQKYRSGRYSGAWVNGKPHGEGTYKLGSIQYSGDWRDGQKDGHGTENFMGKLYSGEWKNDKRNGYGTHIELDGSKRIGTWKNGVLNGAGIFTDTNGLSIHTEFKNGTPVGSLGSLGDLAFLGLLTGMMSQNTFGYTLGVMCEFLQQQNYSAHKEICSALDTLTSTNARENMAKDLLESLNTAGHSELLSYGYEGETEGHAMGLRIQHLEPDFFHFDLFNSGNGLVEYHPFMRQASSGKGLYQTMLRVRVPQKQVGWELLETFLNSGKSFKNPEEAYNAILNLPGARKVSPEDFEEVWQSAQQSGNCTLEWIFAYLRNTMGLKSYTEMRRKLYQAVLDVSDGLQQQDAEQTIQLYSGESLSSADAYARMRLELKRKLLKRHDVLDNPNTPRDFTGSLKARTRAISTAQKLISSPIVKNRLRALEIFRKLVDRGEAIAEAAEAAQKLISDSDDNIRTTAVKLLHKIQK